MVITHLCTQLHTNRQSQPATLNQQIQAYQFGTYTYVRATRSVFNLSVIIEIYYKRNIRENNEKQRKQNQNKIINSVYILGFETKYKQ